MRYAVETMPYQQIERSRFCSGKVVLLESRLYASLALQFHLKCSFLPSTSVTGPTYSFLALKTKYMAEMIRQSTKIGDAQLKPAASTGVVCGLKDPSQHIRYHS
jgi:hypothetical protein